MNKGLVGVVSLGCDKNRVDSEVMLSKLRDGGFSFTDNFNLADVIVINTCAFLESARKEAIDTILEMSQYKTDGKCRCIVVSGCLGQKYGDEVYKYLEEADIIIGINQYDDIADIIERQLKSHDRVLTVCNSTAVTEGDRVLTTLPHIAYLKIADGCDNYCSYCLIPYIRGRFRSRQIDSVVAEARKLALNGVRELILVAQDVTRYGCDLHGSSQLTTLLRQLTAIEGIRWVRLLYCYPELVSDELIDEISTNDKIVKYIDIPLQHVDDGILIKMNRRSRHEQICTLFDKLTSKGIAIRSTFICGFPFETKQTFQAIVDFLSKYKLRNVGFFPYSREDGTASYNFTNQTTNRQRNAMVKKLYKLQQMISLQNNQKEIGNEYACLIDSEIECNDGYLYRGRCYYMTPEIDGCVFVHSQTQLKIGTFYNVAITNALEYDLIGEASNEST